MTRFRESGAISQCRSWAWVTVSPRGWVRAVPSHTFFNRIIKNPDDEFEQMQGVCLSAVLPNLTAENFAISGSESSTHWDLIQETLPTYQDVFGIVLMTTGGNDLIHSYGRSPPRECAMYSATLQQAEPWIESFRIRLGQMLDAITGQVSPRLRDLPGRHL